MNFIKDLFNKLDQENLSLLEISISKYLEELYAKKIQARNGDTTINSVEIDRRIKKLNKMRLALMELINE